LSAAAVAAEAARRTVLSIDPGTAKCGVAIVRQPILEAALTGPADVLHREIVETDRLVARVLALLAAHRVVDTVLIGNATRGAALLRALRAALPPDFPLYPVEEAFTSQRARVRFGIENPPRGWQRLVPAGLRTPPRAYDDYVAVLLAEDWFASDGVVGDGVAG